MSDVRATLLRHGEPVLAGAAPVFQHGHAFVQDGSWSGTFLLPPDGFIAHGGPYELRLDDGRAGRVLIQATREDEGTILVEFVGVGPFPR